MGIWSMTDYLANALLNHVLRNTTYTSPAANLWLALTSDNTTDAGGGTEITGNGYARVQIGNNWGAPASGVTSNNTNLAFASASPSGYSIIGMKIMDASTGGNALFHRWLGVGHVIFTAKAADDTFTSHGHGLVNNDSVILKGSSLPAGASADTQYFVVGATTDTFQLSTTLGGSAINLTGNGQGFAHKVVPRTLLAGDNVKFDSGSITVTLD
jgi:hypothetical protein